MGFQYSNVVLFALFEAGSFYCCDENFSSKSLDDEWWYQKYFNILIVAPVSSMTMIASRKYENFMNWNIKKNSNFSLID